MLRCANVAQPSPYGPPVFHVCDPNAPSCESAAHCAHFRVQPRPCMPPSPVAQGSWRPGRAVPAGASHLCGRHPSALHPARSRQRCGEAQLASRSGLRQLLKAPREGPGPKHPAAAAGGATGLLSPVMAGECLPIRSAHQAERAPIYDASTAGSCLAQGCRSTASTGTMWATSGWAPPRSASWPSRRSMV